MALHNDLGHYGELLACNYLMEKGYTILARNLINDHAPELDIVAEYHGLVVFVEVKTRAYEDRSTGLAAVDRDKQRRIVAAAERFLHEGYRDAPVRFDVITIVGTKEPYTLTHYRHAFTAEEVQAHFSYKGAICR